MALVSIFVMHLEVSTERVQHLAANGAEEFAEQMRLLIICEENVLYACVHKQNKQDIHRFTIDSSPHPLLNTGRSLIGR